MNKISKLGTNSAFMTLLNDKTTLLIVFTMKFTYNLSVEEFQS